MANSLGFTDDLPTNVTIASSPNAADTCGGTLVAPATGTTITYTGGAVGADSTCTVSVDVTSSTLGSHVNNSSNLTSSQGVTELASDTLIVTAASAPCTTLPTAKGTGMTEVCLSGGGPTCNFTTSTTVTATSLGALPPGVTFPYEMVSFTVSNCAVGSTVTFTATYPAALPGGTMFYKFGPESTDPTDHFYVHPATVAGATATFTVTDGGPGDHDLTANGTITDPGGPGVPVVVPTMTQWALFVFALLLLSIGWMTLRRRTRRFGRAA